MILNNMFLLFLFFLFALPFSHFWQWCRVVNHSSRWCPDVYSNVGSRRLPCSLQIEFMAQFMVSSGRGSSKGFDVSNCSCCEWGIEIEFIFYCKFRWKMKTQSMAETSCSRSECLMYCTVIRYSFFYVLCLSFKVAFNVSDQFNMPLYLK